MTTSEFIPSEADQMLAQEAYIRYTAGVAIFHDPTHTQMLHRRDLRSGEQLEEVVGYASHLMYMGLKGVIRYAHPPDIRHSLKELNDKFEEAFPHMHATVVRAYNQEPARLQGLSEALPFIRPAPMNDVLVYKQLCEHRAERLKIVRLMDDVSIDTIFEDLLKDRPVTKNGAKQHDEAPEDQPDL